MYLEDLCFQAQQPAEKAIKAVCIARRTPFPCVHDLARLLALLEENEEVISEAVREAERLSRIAVEPRYPAFGRPVAEPEYRELLEVAREVVHRAQGRVPSGRPRSCRGALKAPLAGRTACC
ncbi:MAG: HEPN domain-containing protein [Armatimonadota bacterium]|nr:HEPN domain-containing protein [Armatimonadota bacterium]